MANRHKGEVGFAGLDGKDYLMSFSVNTLCELDDALGVDNAMQSIVAAGKMTLKQRRKMFWLAVKAHHPDVTELAAGALVLPGHMDRLTAAAIDLAHPDPEPGEAGEAREPNPPQPGQ